MKIERRTFNDLLSKMRVRDALTTHETIHEFGFDQDVEVTLDDGSEIVTSPMQANRIRKRQENKDPA